MGSRSEQRVLVVWGGVLAACLLASAAAIPASEGGERETSRRVFLVDLDGCTAGGVPIGNTVSELEDEWGAPTYRGFTEHGNRAEMGWRDLGFEIVAIDAKVAMIDVSSLSSSRQDVRIEVRPRVYWQDTVDRVKQVMGSPDLEFQDHDIGYLVYKRRQCCIGMRFEGQPLTSQSLTSVFGLSFEFLQGTSEDLRELQKGCG